LRQWQLIQEIAALGSLQKAAEAVGMSQPAVTHALSDMEALLGVALFERHSKGMRATAAGAALLPRVGQALQAIAECADIASSMQAGASGALRVGATSAAVSGLLSRALPAFSANYPEVVVHIRQQEPQALSRSVLEGTLDMAIGRVPVPLPADIEFRSILSDRYAIVCSPRHPLAGKTGLDREELSTYLWLMPPTSTIAERDFHLFWGDGPTPSRRCWIDSRLPVVMCSILEQRQALVLAPYNTVRVWVDSRTLAEVPGTWGPALPAIGVFFRRERLQARGALQDFAAELRRWGDVGPESAEGSAAA
jgi:molybdate transport repressor ModE-like protein